MIGVLLAGAAIGFLIGFGTAGLVLSEMRNREVAAMREP